MSKNPDAALVRGIIPAVDSMKQFDRFIASEYPLCVIVNIHIAQIEHIFAAADKADKKLLIHLDMINGLSGDVHAAEYISQRYSPLGIISTKSAVISACGRLGVLAIQRVFLIDGQALERSAVSAAAGNPDFVEFLPAMCAPLYPMLRDKFNKPLIAGGLIPALRDAEDILNHGVAAVTIAMSKL